MSWKYFTPSEMSCKCGNCDAETHMDEMFMNRLDSLREAYGKPMIVTSAYRCKDHPREKVKTKGGVHTTGKAADIAVDRSEAYILLMLALDHGFTGIGIQQKGEGRFLHLDIGDEDQFLRPTLWSY